MFSTAVLQQESPGLNPQFTHSVLLCDLDRCTFTIYYCNNVCSSALPLFYPLSLLWDANDLSLCTCSRFIYNQCMCNFYLVPASMYIQYQHQICKYILKKNCFIEICSGFYLLHIQQSTEKKWRTEVIYYQLDPTVCRKPFSVWQHSKLKCETYTKNPNLN